MARASLRHVRDAGSDSVAPTQAIDIGKPIAECAYLVQGEAHELWNEGDLVSGVALAIVDGVLNILNDDACAAEDTSTITSMLYASRYLFELGSSLKLASSKMTSEQGASA